MQPVFVSISTTDIPNHAGGTTTLSRTVSELVKLPAFLILTADIVAGQQSAGGQYIALRS
jgi:hypothetical protein